MSKSDIREILKATDCDLNRIMKVNFNTSDINLWEAVTTMHAKTKGEHHLARAMIPTKELPHGFLIEMDAIAAASTDMSVRYK